MDSRSFDRLARLLGGATDRRAGLKAALGLLLGGAAVDAAAKDRRSADKSKDRKRGRRERADADVAAVPTPDAATDPEAEKRKKRRCKPVGGKCRKDKHCCVGACAKPTNGKGKPAKQGTCACLAPGLTCLTTADCCAVDGYQFECLAGICARRAVATGQVCVEGDACLDPEAACVTYQREARKRRGRESAATLCLVGGGGACVKDQDCIGLECNGGICAGDILVPMGDTCVPGQTVCRGRNATCAPYDAGSGGPGGYRCVYPKDAPCDSDVVCAAYICDGGTCGRNPIETGQVCDPRVDTCRNAKAACTTPTAGDDPSYRCLLGPGETCASEGQCISWNCAGTCEGGPQLIDLGQACADGQRCRDGRATCTAYTVQGAPASTFCLLPDLDPCEQSAHCEVNSCLDDMCTAREVPTGELCNPVTQVCIEQGADCESYVDGSGGDDGTHCLLATGLACTANRQCKSNQCQGSRCVGEPANMGQPCDVFSGCAAAEQGAICSVYTVPGVGSGEHCVMPREALCERNSDCETYFCGESGRCANPVGCIDNGSSTQCERDDDCCAGTCQVTEGVGRCIGTGQVWFKLSWENARLDLDSWLWLPESAPPPPSYAGGSAFPLGGAIVYYDNKVSPYVNWFPVGTVPDGTEVWLDVDRTSGPGVERTMILVPRRNGRYRFAVKNFSQCQSDYGSKDACGNGWSELWEEATPITQTNSSVEIYRGDILIARFTPPRDADPATHHYWWHVADVFFDAAGNYAGYTPGGMVPGTGVLKTCAPIPYPMAGSYNEISNFCPVSPA